MQIDRPATDEQRRARSAADEYLRRAEAFDVALCGPAGVPFNGIQWRMVNQHARALRTELAQTHGVGDGVLQNAIIRAGDDLERAKRNAI